MKIKWLFALICASMTLSLAITTAFAAPLGIPAVDGDGQMVVSPNVLTYGSAVGSFTFTFTATADFSTGDAIQLTIPAGWTPPTTASGAGHISWFSGAGCTLAGSPPVAISGSTIIVDIASCSTNSTFSITYANVTPGSISGSPYTFLTTTDISGGNGITPLTLGSPTVDVNPKELTVSATGLTPVNKVYDGDTSATLTIGLPTLVGIVGSDDVTLITSGVVGTFVDKNVGTGKTVNILGLTLGGTTAGNYTLAQPTRTANITKRAITVTAVSDSKDYDGTTSSSGVPSITSGALQGTDTASWMQTFNNRNAGTSKILTPAGTVNDGNSGGNYAVTFATVATGVITPKSIIVYAETDTKIYNGSNSSSGVPLIFPALISPDSSAFTQTFDTKNVGTGKTLNATGKANDGNNGANYAVTFIPDTTGVITAKQLTVSANGLTPANKIYDGTTNAKLTIGSPALVGVISPDVVTLITTGAIGTFVDKDFGTAKTVNISGLTLGGSGAGNYELIQPTRSANITKRAITINAVADSKTYDGTVTSTGVPTLAVSTPLALGDSAPAWTQSFNNKNAGTAKTLTPAGLVNDGNGGNNYIYNYAANTMGVINKRSITVTAVSDSKPYDGQNTSSGIPLLSVGTPLATGDTEPVWTQTFANKNVGTGKTINPAGMVSDGNSGNNYIYNFVSDVTGVITARTIMVTAKSDTKTYDGTTASSLVPTIAPDLVGMDTTSSLLQTFDTPDAGTSKTITPSITIVDGNSGLNYAITLASVSTGVVNKADPVLSVTNSPVLYNGLPQSATVGSGSVSGSVTNILYNGLATVPIEAGTYAVTADFTSSDLNYNSVAGASAGNFVIRKELVLNGGFNLYTGTSKIPTSWVKSSTFASTDGKDTKVKKEGIASVKIVGAVGKVKTLTQTLLLSGSSGDSFTFSFWARGSSIPAAGKCQVQALLYDGTTLKSTQTIPCKTGTYGFQQKTLSFDATSSYTKVVVKFTYSKASGTVWFDLVSLLR